MTSLKPRAAVTLNGVLIENCVLSFGVESNNWFAADRFDITMAYNAMPTAYGLAFLSDNQVEIGVMVDVGQGYQQLILGVADTVDIDIVHCTVSLSGRDHTADFIDNKTEEKFPNLTSSQIAQTLAARHGLTANVTPTDTLAGRYYEIDHVRLTNNISEWTLLNTLAQEEGFDCYVSGTTLNFLPSQQGGSPLFTLTYAPPTASSIARGNFTSMSLRRSMTLAKDVIVKVVSWNARSRTAFTATAKRGATATAAFTDAAQLYTYRIAGLTPAQAQTIANSKLDEITRHERVVDVEMPGETVLEPRAMVALTGTGTSFDQSYFIDSIHRHFDDGGFRQTVALKNHSVESTV